MTFTWTPGTKGLLEIQQAKVLRQSNTDMIYFKYTIYLHISTIHYEYNTCGLASAINAKFYMDVPNDLLLNL